MEILRQSEYFKVWSAHFSLRKSTKVKYMTALKKFDSFIIKEGFEGTLDFDKFHASRKHPDRFQPIQRKFIDRFISDLRRSVHVKDSLIASTVTALKHFFGFLSDMDLIQHNPMQGYPTPKYERPIQNTALSREECFSLLKAAFRKNPFYRQEFVFIWFMLITGLRISEARYLKRKRLNLDTQIVQVFQAQKTEKRSVAISIELAKELERYVQHPEYLKYANQGEELLFAFRGKRMTFNTVRQLLSNLTRDAGLTRHIRAHDLRRTAGYLMQTGGMSIVDIQHQLRHQDLGTTLRYVPPLADMARILNDE
ncbi:tyrosine-type recombinase/integrase [Cohnella panacarvi]|uniref:tyrosine-type recombinase/integrase n=1 Tax=Cohnella panacarvi TaxID=400776 RepID=UPI00047CC4CA|nr:site-specific integrase [Cohnella panacarvi]